MPTEPLSEIAAIRWFLRRVALALAGEDAHVPEGLELLGPTLRDLEAEGALVQHAYYVGLTLDAHRAREARKAALEALGPAAEGEPDWILSLLLDLERAKTQGWTLHELHSRRNET